MGVLDISRKLTAAQRRLHALADPGRAVLAARYFKTGPGQYAEGDRFLGLTATQLRSVAREFRSLPLADLRALLASPWHEERLLALVILVDQFARGDAAQRKTIYAFYMASSEGINNWDLVDVSAAQIVGGYLEQRSRRPLYRLVKSKSPWERRMAMIATAHFIRRGEFEDTFALAAALLDDRHDLIHKATGWMLREVGKRDRAAVETFLRRYAARMPRTMLRYAIERFPAALRRRYLSARQSGGGRAKS